MMNSADAMKNVDGTRRALAITSQPADNEELLVSVSDTGIGLPPQADQIFKAFFTTKPHGTGWGCPSAARSWNRTAVACGLEPTLRAARVSISRYRPRLSCRLTPRSSAQRSTPIPTSCPQSIGGCLA